MLISYAALKEDVVEKVYGEPASGVLWLRSEKGWIEVDEGFVCRFLCVFLMK